MLHAIKGGIISHVNDQFYKGGQFVPDTGLYCGKGSNRVTKLEFEECRQKLFEKTGWGLIYVEGLQEFQFTGLDAMGKKNITWRAKKLKYLSGWWK